jgi:hypothetical protein
MMHSKPIPPLIAIGLLTAILPTTCLIFSVNTLFFVPFLVGFATAVIGCLRIPGRARGTVTALGVMLCLVATVVPFALRAYIGRSGKPVTIVLPAGYEGEFSIVRHRTRGQDVRPKDGEWIFEIPENGVLVVKDDSPFYRWHKTYYLYADGSPAKVKSLGTSSGSSGTGPNAYSGSTDYDGTEHRFEVIDHH